ncbi:hypothetical protein [Shouchella lonarensis]|uniref:YtkA-like n=1 Tax=Shouchella lonarensis TaxID=1464122 RepID=A0A1G6JYY3_9BACI|nr:hypothetical protein [Shouchella lonarensis]SDC23615.1 hypothetical protein SAMN05421737_106128 [Shouchella lonarensis]
MQPAVQKSLNVSLVLLCFTLLLYMKYTLVFASTERDWVVTVVDQPIQVNHTVHLQVFVTDEMYEGVTNATVKGYFSHESGDVSVIFHHVESGLYEAEALFRAEGDWMGEIFVSTWPHEEVQPALLSVEAGGL